LVAVKKEEVKAAQSEGKDSFAQIEAACMNMASAMPVPHFRAWVLAYFKPYQAYDDKKKNANLGNSVVNLALMGLVGAVVAVAAVLLKLGIAAGIEAAPSLVILPIICIIGGMIMSGIYYIVAKVFKGTGGFMEQTYGMVLVGGGAVLLSAVFNVLEVIPFIGGLFSLVAFAISLYGLVSQVRMIKAVHKLSTVSAILVIAIPIVLIAILAFIIGAMMAVALAGFLAPRMMY
jgi:hypothetical protein